MQVGNNAILANWRSSVLYSPYPKRSKESTYGYEKHLTKNDDGYEGFNWNSLGDIKGGRGDLGEEMPVLVYRLMQLYSRRTPESRMRCVKWIAGQMATGYADLTDRQKISRR